MEDLHAKLKESKRDVYLKKKQTEEKLNQTDELIRIRI